MAKLHYRSYNPNQIILFPQRIDEDIAGNDPVRIISAIIDQLDLSKFHKLYHGIGRCAYHPRMMLKVNRLRLYEQYLFLSQDRKASPS